MYTTQGNIISQISENTLVQLTDDEGFGTVNAERVIEAIANADALIDGYCSGRYVVPFEPVPAIIAKCSLDVAIYNLYARRVETMPEVRNSNYNNALKLLQGISKGDINLGATATAPAAAPAHTAEITSQPRLSTRDTLRGF